MSKLRKPAKVVNNVLDSPQTKMSRGKEPSHLGRTNGRARVGSFAGGRALPRDAGTGARSSRSRQGSQTLKHSNTQILKHSNAQTPNHTNSPPSKHCLLRGWQGERGERPPWPGDPLDPHPPRNAFACTLQQATLRADGPLGGLGLGNWR